MPAKTPKSKSSRIQKTLAAAEAALKAGQWFEAERKAIEALDAAIEAGDHGLAADACLPLQEARRQRVIAAIDASEGEVRMVTQVPQELESVDAVSRQKTCDRFRLRGICQASLNEVRIFILQTINFIHVCSPIRSAALRDIFIGNTIRLF